MTDFILLTLSIGETKMAVRVELPMETTRTVLDVYLASLKRAYNTTKQPAFKPIIEKDIQNVQHALGALNEIK
jgi:hypothetical protein